MKVSKEIEKHRKSDYKVHPLILNRWSPRAMTGEEISNEDLMRMFEAARWAPSAYNEQPWRFIYVKKGQSQWDIFFNLLMEGNKTWIKEASVLIVVLSKKTFTHNDKPNVCHLFDAGAAWENLALQAVDLGWFAHGIAGFDIEKTRTDLKVPEDYDIIEMIVIGKHNKKEKLSEEMQKKALTARKELKEIVMEGEFKI